MRFQTLFFPVLFWIAALLPAQVVQVNNTGCPGSGYPMTTSTAQLNRSFDITWPCRPPPVAVGIVGLPGTGGVILPQALSCLPGPCVLYPIPFGASYFALPDLGPIGQWSLPIPGDRSLLGLTLSVQCACVSLLPGCISLSGAVNFTIEA